MHPSPRLTRENPRANNAITIDYKLKRYNQQEQGPAALRAAAVLIGFAAGAAAGAAVESPQLSHSSALSRSRGVACQANKDRCICFFFNGKRLTVPALDDERGTAGRAETDRAGGAAAWGASNSSKKASPVAADVDDERWVRERLSVVSHFWSAKGRKGE